MKTSVFFVLLAAFSTSFVIAAPADINTQDLDIQDFNATEEFRLESDQDAALEKRANLPGLNAVQTRNAREIIGEVKKEKLGVHGCQTAITTALTEVCRSLLQNCTDRY